MVFSISQIGMIILYDNKSQNNWNQFKQKLVIGEVVKLSVMDPSSNFMFAVRPIGSLIKNTVSHLQNYLKSYGICNLCYIQCWVSWTLHHPVLHLLCQTQEECLGVQN